SVQVDRDLLANLLEIDKKEGLVFLQNPAEKETLLVSYVVRFFAGVEEIQDTKIGPLPVPPATAVKMVRTQLHHLIHYRRDVVASTVVIIPSGCSVKSIVVWCATCSTTFFYSAGRKPTASALMV